MKENIHSLLEHTQMGIDDFDLDSLKKRGRKPKGGKIKIREPEKNSENKIIVNIILHLKCSINDLNEHNERLSQYVFNPNKYNPEIPPNILTYNNHSKLFPYSSNLYNEKYNSFSNNSTIEKETPNKINYFNENDIAYNNDSYHYDLNNFDETTTVITGSVLEKNDILLSQTDDGKNNAPIINETDCFFQKPAKQPERLLTKIETQCSLCKKREQQHATEDLNNKDIARKLKNLKILFYKNIPLDKKAACFWCTYDFDNPACYIPRYENDDNIIGYGSFCRPECAVAYLMKENIDDSTKFERYHLLNKMYSGIYDYKKNIKPAPNPFYLLDKFYGNMTIQEYRKLLKTEHTLIVLEKPLTRLFPELHEDYEDVGLHYIREYKKPNENENKKMEKHTTNDGYKVKRQTDKTVEIAKQSIIRETFKC